MKSWIKEPIKQLMDLIDRDDHHERIIFYEQKSAQIKILDDIDRYYCDYQYINSLYTVGRYDDLLAVIDPVIEFVFIHDVDFIPSRTYEQLLYIKTEALHETLRYDQALDIGKQLLGMHPSDSRYKKLVEKTYLSHLNFQASRIKIGVLALIFLASVFGAFYWMFGTSAEEQKMTSTFTIVLIPCILAVVILGCTHLVNYLISIRKTEQLISSKKRYR